MMRLTIAILVAFFCSQALAQETALAAKVRAALTDVTNGICSPQRLSPYARAGCESAPPMMTQQLKQIGPIERIQDYGVQPWPNGQKPTVFRITFQNGVMTWFAEEAPDGKIGMLWTDGATAPKQ